MGSEKFCLSWNDFESNISVSFRDLREEKELFDVTLSCGDEQIQAHKLVLSACSPFFRSILKKNPHHHPLLYLKSVKYTDLQSVLNFMYHGEVNVAQEELNSFLAVAEDLKVKGLTQNTSNHQQNEVTRQKQPVISRPPAENRIPPPLPPPSLSNNTAPVIKRHARQNLITKPYQTRVTEEIEELQVTQVKSEPRDQQLSTHLEVGGTSSGGGQLSNVEDMTGGYTGGEDVETYEDNYTEYEGGDQGVFGGADQGGDDPAKGPMTMMTGQDPEALMAYVTENTDVTSPGSESLKWMCRICGKPGLNRRDVRNHVESLHFPDMFSYQCNLCQMTLKSRKALDNHKYRKHPRSSEAGPTTHFDPISIL